MATAKANEGFYITIQHRIYLGELIQQLVDKKLINRLTEEEFNKLFKEAQYPIRIPIELDSLIDLIGNPIVRKVLGNKADEAVNVCLKKIMEAGC